MATEKNKGTKWDGKSRVSTDLYRKRHDEIFKKDKEKFDKLQQEQRDLDESYRQSLKNKKEREEQEDNEEYLKQLKDKL